MGAATITSLGDTTTANMLINMLTMTHHQEPGLSVRARFVPNETMFVLQDAIERDGEGGANRSGDRSLTISHFGKKNRKGSLLGA